MHAVRFLPSRCRSSNSAPSQAFPPFLGLSHFLLFSHIKSLVIVGLLFVVYLFGTFSSTYMGRLSDQHGNGRVLILGLLIMLTGGLLTLLQPLVFKFIGLAIFTFGMLGSHSVACGWVGKLNQGDKAQSSSMYMFFYYAGASSLGTLGGVFLESYGWSGVIGMVAAAVIICLLVVVRLELAVRQHLLWHH